MNELVYENRQWWNEVGYPNEDDEILNDHTSDPYIPFHQYRSFSEYPYIVRDITLQKGNLLQIILKGGKYLEKVFKIGEYEPKNNETFRIIFQSKERNLTNNEIDEVMKGLYEI